LVYLTVLRALVVRRGFAPGSDGPRWPTITSLVLITLTPTNPSVGPTVDAAPARAAKRARRQVHVPKGHAGRRVPAEPMITFAPPPACRNATKLDMMRNAARVRRGLADASLLRPITVTSGSSRKRSSGRDWGGSGDRGDNGAALVKRSAACSRTNPPEPQFHLQSYNGSDSPRGAQHELSVGLRRCVAIRVEARSELVRCLECLCQPLSPKQGSSASDRLGGAPRPFDTPLAPHARPPQWCREHTRFPAAIPQAYAAGGWLTLRPRADARLDAALSALGFKASQLVGMVELCWRA